VDDSLLNLQVFALNCLKIPLEDSMPRKTEYLGTGPDDIALQDSTVDEKNQVPLLLARNENFSGSKI